MTELVAKQKKISKWYFGGLAGAGAASITHPLDLIKANLQTQKEKLPVVRFTEKIVREQGFLSLYSGISASILRQMTYSLTRFGLYEFGKDFISTETFGGKLLLAGLSGMAGGFVGTPADMVNVRMQNDVKLPKHQRRNYKNAIDGLMRVYKEEGFKRLFSGASTATIRGVLMTVGQIAFYDQTKQFLLCSPFFQDNLNTHFTASLFAASMATVFTQPIDVLKTRAMNAKAGQYNGLMDICKHTCREGPSAFFKGFVPAFIRLGPHTILMFVILEQLRLNFGVIV